MKVINTLFSPDFLQQTLWHQTMSLALVSQWLTLLLAATTLPEFSRSQSTNGNSQQPNIVFVLADDYGYNDIGYHSDQIRTPNMDAVGKGDKRMFLNVKLDGVLYIWSCRKRIEHLIYVFLLPHVHIH